MLKVYKLPFPVLHNWLNRSLHWTINAQSAIFIKPFFKKWFLAKHLHKSSPFSLKWKKLEICPQVKSYWKQEFKLTILGTHDKLYNEKKITRIIKLKQLLSLTFSFWSLTRKDFQKQSCIWFSNLYVSYLKVFSWQLFSSCLTIFPFSKSNKT